jgi:hypothetical protein
MVKVLDKQQVGSDKRIVTTVRVTVHTYGPKVDGASWNHWSIYLILADGSGSVRSNMRAEFEGYNNGLLEWSDCPYTETNSAIDHWDFVCKPGTSVQDIANIIYEKGRERYDLKGGKGCRYWVLEQTAPPYRRKLTHDIVML